VTSTDYVAAVLESGRRRAHAEGQLVTFREADAERLPFADGSFDVVLSTFGVMFAPNQEQAARELLRVCAPGGRIGLANWTPDSLIDQVFQITDRYVPAADVPSPALWGTRARLDELLASGAREIRTERREFVFRYRSPMHWIEVFRTYYGPITVAFAALEPGAQAACTRELLDLIEEGNRSRDRSLVLPSEYLEVVVLTR
jgi:SAM-dependent methyltransferase